MLQKIRKSKQNKASNLKITMQELMQDREYESEVYCTFEKYKILCKEAKETHESLLKKINPLQKRKNMRYGSKQNC